MESIESRHAKFGVLISIQIPSVLCSLGIIHHIVSTRTTRRALHNHAPILLLFVGLMVAVVDLSMVLNFLRTGSASPNSDAYCLIWNFIDYFLYALLSMVMLWASIERHILIFHQHQLLDTQRKRLIIHYGPLVVSVVYPILFNVYVTFIHPCANRFDYNQVVCAGLCLVIDTPNLGVFDQFAHTIIPSILTVVLSVGLWCRVVWQKHYRMRRAMEWRQHRKIILQFLPVCVLYLTGILPFGFVQCYHMIHGPTSLSVTIQQLYFFYQFYLTAILYPFACLIGMPEVYYRWFHRKTPRVVPLTVQPTIKTNK